jgi:hypothetical protein
MPSESLLGIFRFPRGGRTPARNVQCRGLIPRFWRYVTSKNEPVPIKCSELTLAGALINEKTQCAK